MQLGRRIKLRSPAIFKLIHEYEEVLKNLYRLSISVCLYGAFYRAACGLANENSICLSVRLSVRLSV